MVTAKSVTTKSVKTATTHPAQVTRTRVAPITVPKVAPKIATLPACNAWTKPLVKAAAKPKIEKPAKVKKPKLVRDSFTIPKTEYNVLDELKQRAGRLANPAKKSELLRAGIKALAAMSDVAFLAAVQAVPAIKTGRPSKN